MDEAKRLEALRRYDILDTSPDGALDRITAIASRMLAAPMALISFVDADRIWFKSHHGLELAEVAREPGFCASCIEQDGPWLVTDCISNKLAADNFLVTHAPHVRFYLGIPLRTPDGLNLGTLSVLDTVPHRPSDADVACLRDLAHITMDELELRLTSLRAVADYGGEFLRREQVDEKNLGLTRELAHRSKNLLAIVLSIVQQTKDGPNTVDEYAGHLTGRIRALARTHDLLLADAWVGVTLDDLILRQIEPLLGGTDRVRLRGPSVLLTPAAAQVLGIAFHELAANCVRHGSCADPDGHLEVLWAAEPGPEGPILGIRWREYGPRTFADCPPGFGKVVLERLTPQALNGKASWSQPETGDVWSLSCPLNHAGQLK